MTSRLRVGIVSADFHTEMSSQMIAAAQDEVQSRHADVVCVVTVAGSYEIPLAVARMLREQRVDAVIVLGYIERGQTLHGEVMGHVVHTALMTLSLENDCPIGIGIIGPGATMEQATTRAAHYPRAAVIAALRLARPRPPF